MERNQISQPFRNESCILMSYLQHSKLYMCIYACIHLLGEEKMLFLEHFDEK